MGKVGPDSHIFGATISSHGCKKAHCELYSKILTELKNHYLADLSSLYSNKASRRIAGIVDNLVKDAREIDVCATQDVVDTFIQTQAFLVEGAHRPEQR